MVVLCKQCQQPFSCKPSWQKNGGGIYCSRTCQYDARKQGKTTPCFICSKQVYKSPKELRSSKSQRFFCSKSCQTTWRNRLYKGSRHPLWRGGKSVDYRNILLQSGKVPICQICNTNDERVLCVHHLDENRENNQVTNLAWLSYNCHHLVHIHGTKVPM